MIMSCESTRVSSLSSSPVREERMMKEKNHPAPWDLKEEDWLLYSLLIHSPAPHGTDWLHPAPVSTFPLFFIIIMTSTVEILAWDLQLLNHLGSSSTRIRTEPDKRSRGWIIIEHQELSRVILLFINIILSLLSFWFFLISSCSHNFPSCVLRTSSQIIFITIILLIPNVQSQSSSDGEGKKNHHLNVLPSRVEIWLRILLSSFRNAPLTFMMLTQLFWFNSFFHLHNYNTIKLHITTHDHHLKWRNQIKFVQFTFNRTKLIFVYIILWVTSWHNKT